MTTDQQLHILSVNIGQPTAVKASGADGVEHLVVTRVFNGRQIHGGELKAVYLYPAAHYATWSAELGRDLPFGQFGENLTVEGMLEDAIRIGDLLRAGTALLQVTEPRGPCYKLDIKMGIPEFKTRMRDTGRTGFYTRVIDTGQLTQGDLITRTQTDTRQPTVLETHRREG